MKASVWTNWTAQATGLGGKPKCIFIGEVSSAPRPGDFIVVREGFAAEVVLSVTYYLIRDEIEISIHGVDAANNYGPCLYHGQ